MKDFENSLDTMLEKAFLTISTELMMLKVTFIPQLYALLKVKIYQQELLY